MILSRNWRPRVPLPTQKWSLQDCVIFTRTISPPMRSIRYCSHGRQKSSLSVSKMITYDEPNQTYKFAVLVLRLRWKFVIMIDSNQFDWSCQTSFSPRPNAILELRAISFTCLQKCTSDVYHFAGVTAFSWPWVRTVGIAAVMAVGLGSSAWVLFDPDRIQGSSLISRDSR